jgi:hypothetical protein
MNRLGADRIPIFIVASGALASAVTFGIAGGWVAFSAVAGVILALGNYYVYRWIANRVTSGSIRKQAALSLLMVVKVLVLFGLISILVIFRWVDPIGFMVGLSALVIGLLSGSVRYFLNGQSTQSER